MKSHKRKKGFTLIELLVVIAIIGILAGLMFPAIAGAIESANATRIGNQGRGVVTAIVTENMNREASNSATIWPVVGTVDPDYVPNSVFTATSKSNDYFGWLIKDQVVESMNGYGPFAGGGVGTAPSAEAFIDASKEHNIWNVISNLEQAPVGDPPFMFTRNFYLTTTLLLNEGNAAAWKATTAWHTNKKPFGRNRCVAVSRGAAVNIIRGRDMTRARFIGDSVFNSNTNKDVAIWYALGADQAPTP